MPALVYKSPSRRVHLGGVLAALPMRHRSGVVLHTRRWPLRGRLMRLANLEWIGRALAG